MEETHHGPTYHQPHHEEGEFDFRHLYFLILRKLWLIGLISAVGMLIITPMVVNQPLLYRSTGLLKVEQKEQKVLSAENVAQDLPGSIEYINTVMSAITSLPVMIQAVKDLKLSNNRKFNPIGNLPDSQIASILSSKVDVRLRKGTRLIEVSVNDTDPQSACTLATATINAFLKETYRRRNQISRTANDYLTEEASKLKSKLKASEEALQRYKEEHDAVSLQENQNIIVEKLHQLSSAVTAAQDLKLKKEADLELFRRTDPSRTEDLLKIPSVAALPEINSLNQQITQARADLDSFKERYLPRHPKYIAAQNRIHSLEDARARAAAHAGQDIIAQHDVAGSNAAKLEASLKEQEAKSLQLGKLSVEYNVLTREVESDTALYASVMKRMKETGLSMESENAPFQIVEDPLPGRPLKSNTLLTLAGSLLLITILSAILIIVADLLRNSVRSVDQAERRFGLPVVGAVPEIRISKGEPVIAANSPGSPVAEAYRTLRTSLSMHDRDRSIAGVTLVTSAIPDEGKTITSINMGICFSQFGEKTLIVDADLRRPSVQRLLLDHDSPLPGLSDFIQGQATLEESVHPTRYENVFIMPSGKRTTRPAEILAKSGLDAVFHALRDSFSHIVVDTAPVNAVSDTLLIAPHADRCCLVIRSDSTPLRVVTRALQLLHKSGAAIAGLILNRLQHGGAGYYYYYYAGKYGKESVYGQTPPA